MSFSQEIARKALMWKSDCKTERTTKINKFLIDDIKCVCKIFFSCGLEGAQDKLCFNLQKLFLYRKWKCHCRVWWALNVQFIDARRFSVAACQCFGFLITTTHNESSRASSLWTLIGLCRVLLVNTWIESSLELRILLWEKCGHSDL